MKDRNGTLRRREFLYLSACAMAGTSFAGWHSDAFAAHGAIADGLPSRPTAGPLDWRERADAFDGYVMDPANKVLQSRPDGSRYFASALDGTGDGGLTTFAPLVLGKILRGDAVDSLVPSMAAYYSDEYGIFLDGTHAVLCEYWYLMNVNALAAGVVGSHLSHDAVWTGRVRSSADRLIALAHQIHYDFNDQGYHFDTRTAWTKQNIYRQPDAIGGYAYLMLFAYKMFGDARYLAEAKEGIERYLSFARNPWYEVPSGAMACLAAAWLSVQATDVDVHKALGFVLDPGGHPLQTGAWGGQEVNGLMAGFCTEPPGEAYSMESLVTLPYLLPMVRYRPEFADDVGRYLLNTAANMRLFYSDCIARANQSRPELTAAIPYERLTHTLNGKSPYASGDYGSNRSIYGGAYALWWGELVKPTSDPYILEMNLSLSDFLEQKKYPTYLYYNPGRESKQIALPLPAGEFDLYDLKRHRFLSRHKRGEVPVEIAAEGSSVVVVLPSGAHRHVTNGILFSDGVAFDYARRAEPLRSAASRVQTGGDNAGGV